MTMQNDNFHQDTEVVEPVHVTPEALSLITKAEIDVQIATAKAYPRSMKKFLDKALSMATASTGIAESCSYALPRDGKTIEGPSVRLAEIVVSAFGNIRIGARIVANDGRWITAQGICHDLETNTAATIEVRRKITNKHGRTYSDDMQTVTGNAACAIAYRNVAFKVVPLALVQEVYDAAKKVALGDAQTLVQRRTAAVDYFTGLGVKPERICAALSVQKIEDIDLEKLFVLRGMANMLRQNESTLDELFPDETKKKDDRAGAALKDTINKINGDK